VSETELYKRIVVNPAILGGKPIIRGQRLAVEHVLGLLAAGTTFEELLADYEWLEREDIFACLEYAHRAIADESVEPLVVGG